MKFRFVLFMTGLIAAFAASPVVPSATGQETQQTQTFDTAAGPVKIIPLYHASMRIEADGKYIYVDPAKPANFAGLPQADLILITDIHGDHMDPAAVNELSKSSTVVIAPPSTRAGGCR